MINSFKLAQWIGAIGTIIGFAVISVLFVIFIWSFFQGGGNGSGPDDGSSSGGGSTF